MLEKVKRQGVFRNFKIWRVIGSVAKIILESGRSQATFSQAAI
jgi:hypothetical protein